MSLLINTFFAPEDSGGGSGPISDEPLTRSSMQDMLSEDDDSDSDDSDDDIDINLDEDDDEPKPKKVSKKDSSEETDDSDTGEDADETEGTEEDPLKALEEDLKDPDEEDLELVTPVKRGEILKKYPNIFKDFPYLQKAYYREQQFTEIFPTVDEAKSSAEDTKILNAYDQDLGEGNLERILANVHKGNPNSFAKIVDNFLPTLARVDTNAYHHLVGNVGKQLIQELVTEGNKPGQEILKNVALLVNQFLFSSSDYEPPSKLSKESAKNPEAEKLEKDRAAFNNQRFTVARDETLTKIDNSLKSTIDENIDPRGIMTPFVKKHAMRDAQEKLENLLRRDTRFRAILGKHWEKAEASNYSAEAMKSIRSTYLSRAKALLPAVLKSARIEALKGMGKRVNSSEGETKTRKGPIPNSGKSTTSSNSGNSSTKSEKLPPGTDIRKFLMNG